MSKGRTHEAEGIDEFRTAMKSDLTHTYPEAHFCLGKTRYDEGNSVEAVTEFKEAIKVILQSAAVHNRLALALDKQGLLEQAPSVFRGAVKLEADNGGYHANLAHELDLLHREKEAAVEDIRKARSSSTSFGMNFSASLQIASRTALAT